MRSLLNTWHQRDETAVLAEPAPTRRSTTRQCHPHTPTRQSTQRVGCTIRAEPHRPPLARVNDSTGHTADTTRDRPTPEHKWPEPAEQAAIHTELWRLANIPASRTEAVTLTRELYRHAPGEELRERLATLTSEPPPYPTPPPLPPEVTRVDLDLDTVLQRANLDMIDKLATK